MVEKKRYAPVLDIVHHWMGMRATNTPISITSFVTRIAANLGLLENAQLYYFPDDTSHYVGETHFVQAHFMRRDAANGKMIMTWFGHSLELPLLAPQFDMYTVRSLTMQLDVEPPRQSIGGVMTRAQRRRAEKLHHRAQGEDTEEPVYASTPSEPSWYFSSTGGQSSYQPSHSTQYYGGGSASRALSRDLGYSASARYHTPDMADINSAMGGMNLG